MLTDVSPLRALSRYWLAPMDARSFGDGARAMAQPRRGLRPQETLESDRSRSSTDRAALRDLDPAALEARLQEWFGEAARGVRKADGSVDFGKVQALMSESRRQSGRAAGPLLSMAA